ncbi:MAG: hypothetical protein ACK458_13330, partial [Sphingobacteriales bacterium]
MRFLYALPLIAAIGFLAARPGVSMPNASMPNAFSDTLAYPEETHFKNIRQLTFGGDNAEAYFSYDGKYLIFQKTNPKEGIQCDQIYIAKVPTSPNEPFVPKLVSTGKGRTTCGYFMKDGK